MSLDYDRMMREADEAVRLAGRKFRRALDQLAAVSCEVTGAQCELIEAKRKREEVWAEICRDAGEAVPPRRRKNPMGDNPCPPMPN